MTPQQAADKLQAIKNALSSALIECRELDEYLNSAAFDADNRHTLSLADDKIAKAITHIHYIKL